jgi:hypothetical protein
LAKNAILRKPSEKEERRRREGGDREKVRVSLKLGQCLGHLPDFIKR